MRPPWPSTRMSGRIARCALVPDGEHVVFSHQAGGLWVALRLLTAPDRSSPMIRRAQVPNPVIVPYYTAGGSAARQPEWPR
jgi:hypothetical protein